MPPSRIRRIEASIAALAPGYLARRAEDLIRLRDALARTDWQQIAAIGHELRGTGASYGFSWISEIGARLEESAECRDADAVARLVGSLEARLARCAPPSHPGQRSR